MNQHTPTSQIDAARQPPSDGRRRRFGLGLGRIGTVLAVIGVALLAGLIWYLANNSAQQRRQRPTASVGVVAAKAADIPITLDALGSATPRAIATVSPQVSGVLVSVTFTEGQTVEKGQVLAQIDPRPFQLALEQAEGNLKRDQAQLKNAQITLARYQTLLKQDSIAQQEVDTQAATARQLEGTVATDQAAVDAAKLDLSYASITAPISGRVGLRPVDEGNYVASGSGTSIAVITQVTPMDVSFAIPEDELSRVAASLKAGQPVAVTVYDRTRTKALAQGKLLTLDNQVDATTGTIKAKAEFANADGVLFPNQFVNVQLLLETIKGAIVVPAAAVRHGPNGDFVYVVGEDKTAKSTPVKTGPSHGDLVSITSGLKGGENVVTEGGDRLSDGAAVQLPGDNPQPQQDGQGRRGRRQEGGG